MIDAKLSGNSDPELFPMPRYNQRQPDWVNIYYGWKIFFILLHYANKVFTFLAIAPLAIAIVCSVIWFPDYTSTIITGYFAVLLAIVALCVVWIIGVLIFRLFVPRKPRPPVEWVPQGAIANPKGDWFDSNGNRLWKRVGDHWERTTTLER